MTMLKGRLGTIQHKILPKIRFGPNTNLAEAAWWINTHVQSGIEGEPDNLTSKMAHTVSHMDEPGKHLMICKKSQAFGPYFCRAMETSLGHEFLALAVFKGQWPRLLTRADRRIVDRLSPVGANGIKTLIEPKDISYYMDLLEPALEYFIPRAQFFVFFDCHSGPFNIKCSEQLHDRFGVSYDKIKYTSKRHPDKYYKKLVKEAEALYPYFENKKLLTNWVIPYLERDSFEDPATKLKGRYIHKSGKTRNVPELDRIYVQKLRDVKEQCKEYWLRTNRKALVIMFDDTMSKFGCTASSVVNQLGKYANVVVIVTMYEY